MLPLAFLIKKLKNNPKRFLIFERSSIFLNVLRKLPISVAFYGKNHFFNCFKNFKIFWRSHVIFFKQPTIWTFVEILLFQLHYTAKLLPPAVFGKIKIFSEKPFFFQNSSNCLILWEIWQSELHSSANMPPSVSFEKLQLFLEKTQLLNVLRNPCNSFAFEIKLAIFSLFQKNSIFFFKKTIYFFE